MYPSLALALAAAAPASAALIQIPGLQVPKNYASNTNVVRQMFNTSYQTYSKYAYGHDDLSPLSLSYNDPRNGWGASIADAMSTMYIMGGFETEFEAAIKHFSGINFNQSYTSDTVSLFETTIRYVGGFLSAYELSGYKYPILVQKAQQITNKLVHGFDGAMGFPYGFVDFSTNQPTLQSSNIAEAGTLTMEWGRLSDYTFNTTYRKLAEGSVKKIISLPPPLPSLPGQGIYPNTGTFASQYVTWGGGSDSYFEYLIKYPRLTNTLDPTYATAWRNAVYSSIKYLKTTSTVGGWTYIQDAPTPNTTSSVGSHLECFLGGNWIMGGRMLNDNTIVNYGLALTDSCWNTYASTATGIGPEVFAFVTPQGDTSGYTDSNVTFYNEHGFYIPDGYEYYDMRPEVLESNFYAWRATGNTKYLARAQSAVQSLNKYVAVNGAYAGIGNVNDGIPGDSGYFDNTESFWFAEVLKYLYLTFDDPSHISLDEWVFNTEAHPLKAPLPLPVYPLANSAPTATNGPQASANSTNSTTPVKHVTIVSPIPGLPAGLKQLSDLYARAQ